jgi:hypothetical protein
MAGETCPRCHHRNGYPIPGTIPNGKKMVFVCRDCKHRWIKRNASGGIFTKWYVYGTGFLIGIIYEVHEIFKERAVFEQGVFGRLADKIKEFFETILNMIRGLF